MSQTYSYSKVELAKISDALSAIFAELQAPSGDYSRSANANFIILVSQNRNLDQLESIVDELSLIHPSRFFIITRDDKRTEIEAFISARCHGLSKDQHVCSEVVRLFVPGSKLAALASVIRASTLTGMSTELYVDEGQVDLEYLREVAPLSDLMLFDSGEHAQALKVFSEFASTRRVLVDLRWVALGIWRDQIKQIFSKHFTSAVLPSLKHLHVRGKTKGSNEESASCYLMAGWLLSKLEMQGCCLKSDGSFECSYGQGTKVSLSIESIKDSTIEQLIGINLEFSASTFGSAAGRIELIRGAMLEAQVELRQSYKLTRPFDEETKVGLLKRYFLIGESTANYMRALKAALQLSYGNKN